MKGFLHVCLVVVGLLTVITGTVVGIAVAHSYWNCTSWAKTTGDTTKVIAGTCMVFDKKRQRFEIYSSYIRRNRIEHSAE